MGTLPCHGKVSCTRCFSTPIPRFDVETSEAMDGRWRITHNPLAWGNSEPEIVVLGFSKGPTQAGSLSSTPHNDIAYKKGRTNVGKILAHIGVIEMGESDSGSISKLIADSTGRFHFGSLVRCTVERKEGNTWKGTSGSMLGGFVGSSFGKNIVTSCIQEHLTDLPSSVKLVILFGYGSAMSYLKEARALITKVRKGAWRKINEVAYTDGKVVFVHVEHFAAQGNLIPEWLGLKPSTRSRLGIAAKEAVEKALKVAT